TQLAAQVESLQYVLRVTRCRDAKEHVSSLAQCLNLPLKDVVVAIVVTHGGQNRAIRSQRHRAHRRAVHRQPAHKLRYKMLRIRRAAAIAGHHQLAPGEHSLAGGRGGIGQRRKQYLIRHHLLQRSYGVSQFFQDQTSHSSPILKQASIRPQLRPHYIGNGISGSYSKLMRSRSIAYGRFCTCVWIAPTYSPRIPMKTSTMELRKKMPITTGAMPTEKLRQNSNL